MSKTSLLIGCLLAAAMHGLLLLPLTASHVDEVTPAPAAPKTKLAVTPPPEPAPAPPEPKPKPPEPPKTGTPAPKPKPPMQEVVKPPAPPKPDKPDPVKASAGEDDKALPPLRIVWASANEVRTVARVLGLRIVAVNAEDEATGEIDPYSGKLKDFTGRLDHYSNRVRTLPRDFFGATASNPDGRAVARFWILVPVAVDRQWVALQRSAIAQRGMTAGQVREVEARFNGRGGRLRLSITRVHSRPGAAPTDDKET